MSHSTGYTTTRYTRTNYKWKFDVFLKIGLTGKYFSVEIEEGEMKGGGGRKSPTYTHTHAHARAVDLSMKYLSRG